MKNKICLIVPYFGQLPKYSDLFFLTLKHNLNINVLLITDNVVELDLPNLKIVQISFEQLREHIQSFFEFKIILDKPYKLCDFKPAYGLIFQKWLKNFDFWGYTDLDVAWGDSSLFLTDDLLNQYDQLYQHGHLSLFRNNKYMNELFMDRSIGMDYQQVFTTSVVKVFDEIPGIQRKVQNDPKIRSYNGIDFFDADPWKYHITRVRSNVPESVLNHGFDYNHECVYWKEGKLYRKAIKNNQILRDELLYFHFQKRNYQVKLPNKVITPIYFSNTGCMISNLPSDTQNDIDQINQFSSSKQIEWGLRKSKYIWQRRLKKYILRKG